MENQNQRSNEETEIDLVELFWVLWRKLPLMIAVGLFTALLAFGGSKFLMTPTYQSVTKIYILNKQDSSNANVTYSDLQAGTQLVKDYSELIKSRFVLEAVIEQLNLPLSYEQLSGKVTVSTPADTRVISIAVTDSNPVAAMKYLTGLGIAEFDDVFGNTMGGWIGILVAKGMLIPYRFVDTEQEFQTIVKGLRP